MIGLLEVHHQPPPELCSKHLIPQRAASYQETQLKVGKRKHLNIHLMTSFNVFSSLSETINGMKQCYLKSEKLYLN